MDASLQCSLAKTTSADALRARALRKDASKPAATKLAKLATHWSMYSADARKLSDPRTAGLLQLLWLAVLGGGFALIGGLPAMQFQGLSCLVPHPNVLQLAWVFFILACLRWVPENHNSAAIFYVHATIGGIVTDGLYRGGWRSATFSYIVFLMTPLLDYWIGTDARAPPPNDQLNSNAFRMASLTQPVFQLVFLVWSCHIVAYGNDSGPLSLVEIVAGAISFGTYSSTIGITYAHELCHRHARLDNWLGSMNLVLVCYPHFNVEHNKGHHKMVGTEEDPATARAGETFYQFLPRVVLGELKSAAHLEARRLQKAGKPFLHPSNELLHLFGASAAVACALGACLGWGACLFFCVQSVMAVLLFESVNYFEHYGLERRQLSDDMSLPIEFRYESTGLRHAWDSPTRLGNTIMLKLQRHADHHTHAGKRYQQLQTSDSSPQLPGGYATMIIIALCPPLWFAVMDPRLLEHRRRAAPQEYRHWPLGVVPPLPPKLSESGIKGAGRVIIACQRWGRCRLTNRRNSGAPRQSTDCIVCLDPERRTHKQELQNEERLSASINEARLPTAPLLDFERRADSGSLDDALSLCDSSSSLAR